MPAILVMGGLLSLLLVACGDTGTSTTNTVATNIPAATANPGATSPVSTSAAAVSTGVPETTVSTSIDPVSTAVPASPMPSPADNPTQVPASPTNPAGQPTQAISTTASRTTKLPATTPIPATPAVSARGNAEMSVEAAIIAAKSTISKSWRQDQRQWLEALPGMPGNKLYSFATCGNIPAAPVGQEDKTVSICQSNVLGTTTAINKNGSWEVGFSLVWPGKLPPGMARPQSGHNWSLVVEPSGKVSITSDTGAPLPAFPIIL